MGVSSLPGRRAGLLALVGRIPAGRVATIEVLAEAAGLPAPLVVKFLAELSSDERDLVPWHRVVARGGAIGRGPNRDQQFARLVREGVVVSPAGVVQDFQRAVIVSFDDAGPRPSPAADVPPQGGRSRGMKQRP